MANRKNTTIDGIRSSTQKSILSHTRALGRTAAGAMALAMFFPAAPIAAYVATEEKPPLTVEDLTTVSAGQIESANALGKGSLLTGALL